MGSPKRDISDTELVRQCLAGKETAWCEFYSRYMPMVRETVRRQKQFLASDVEDVTQNVFVGMVSALETYDPSYSLAGFVCMIAKRECIDAYRRTVTAKRDAPTDPIDHHDSHQPGLRLLQSHCKQQDEQMSSAELAHMLNQALSALGKKCRDLLRMRYYDDLPYKNITEKLGVAENTLVVQVRRCIDELRAAWDELARTGIRR